MRSQRSTSCSATRDAEQRPLELRMRMCSVQSPVQSASAVMALDRQALDHAASDSAQAALDQRDATDETMERERRVSAVALVVALFRDAFVCRHFTRADEHIDGFAQPYDVNARCDE